MGTRSVLSAPVRWLRLLGLLSAALLAARYTQGQGRTIDPRLYHLRNAGPMEWREFAGTPDGKQMNWSFRAQVNPRPFTLCLRQQDVKQDWLILLNGRELGKLAADEKDLFWYVEVPAGWLKEGANRLQIATAADQADDIRVGQVVLSDKPLADLLQQASLQVEVREVGSSRALPCRLTITNLEGTLQSVRAQEGQTLAVRPGYVYTGNGRAALGLPPGSYRIYATRGTEYGVDSVDVVLQPGDRQVLALGITRQLATPGWVSSDPHVHTLTYSGHGDATLPERALSLAGEGIELPILTDHNVVADLQPAARQLELNSYFTPVSGMEVTTPVGHFNVFPLAADTPVPDFRLTDWDTLSRNLAQVPGLEVLILNHARDIHAGFRPFDPRRHLALAGRTLTGWKLPANAMEVINSGAMQTHPLQLSHDWFGLVNGGHLLTPVGASDSHDVSRYLVGQGRTYIRAGDQVPGQIDVAEAVANFKAGKVLVSFGLLAEAVFNGQYGPGELAPRAKKWQVEVSVQGADWAQVDKLTLFANGKMIREAALQEPGRGGIKWQGTWKLPRSRKDFFLVAVAEGPGGNRPFWPIGKPYQALSPDWEARVMGMTGAIFIDADGDKRFTSARDYALSLFKKYEKKLPRLIRKLRAYDESVAVQVASELQRGGVNLEGPEITALLQKAAPPTKAGFALFLASVRQSELFKK